MKNLFSTAIIVSLAYGAFGIFVLDIVPEHVLLGSVIVVIACLLPDIDGSSELPARELGGLLAAVSPMVVLEFFPDLGAGGVSRVALVVVGSYVLTRLLITRGLQRFTAPKGMIHSIPAAVIAFEITYLLFNDLYITDRLYVSTAAFVGFFGHLVIEAYGNLDLLAKATGKATTQTPVLKLFAATWGRTFVLYACVLGLGWLIAQEYNPNLHISADVRY